MKGEEQFIAEQIRKVHQSSVVDRAVQCSIVECRGKHKKLRPVQLRYLNSFRNLHRGKIKNEEQ